MKEAPVHGAILQEAHGAGVAVRKDRFGAIGRRRDRAESGGNDGKRIVPCDALEAAFALPADPAHRVQHALVGVGAIEVAGDLGAQHPTGTGMIGRATNGDGAAVFYGGQQRAGIGAIVRAGAADDVAVRSSGRNDGHASYCTQSGDCHYASHVSALPPLRSVTLADGTSVPALGLGTWRMGERLQDATREVAALRHGLDLGMKLIDTAEMYGDGGAEKIVARAVEGRRDDVFIVSKVYPHNAGARSTIAACERSLRRLATDRIDLYLLHWPGSIPLQETVDAFERLQADGKILRWGVSNFDLRAMRALETTKSGGHCATNQVLYNLSMRGIEFDLLPWCAGRSMPVMAYSPVNQGALADDRRLAAFARTLDVTAAQLALAWSLRNPGVMAIPKSSTPARLDENRRAASLHLTPDVTRELDRLFPPPRRAAPLAML
jgi:diketogulonate reductase-like aldo/keto reductase